MILLKLGLRIVLLIILVAGSYCNLMAKEKFHFEHILASDGLSQNTIYCIHQDRNGFLWIGTEDGLNRYDGYEIKIFRKKTDGKNGLSGAMILAIAEDPDNVLWFATDNHVTSYDPRSGRFEQHLVGESKPESADENRVEYVFIDSKANIWAGKRGGLYLFDRQANTFLWWSQPAEESGKKNRFFLPIHIFRIYEDSKGVLWIIGSGGIFTFDYQRGRTVPYFVGSFKSGDYKDEKYPDDIEVRSIFEDQGGTLWIGTLTGKLYKFNSKTEKFVQYKYRKDSTVETMSEEIRVIGENRDYPGRIWIGTAGAGLFLISSLSEPIDTYIHNPNDPHSLSNQFVSSLFQDKDGVMWVGTDRGLNKRNYLKGAFHHWKKEPNRENCLSSNWTWCIHKDSNGVFWIGTNNGLNRYDKTSETFTHYLHSSENEKSISHNEVRVIYEDDNGVLWLGTILGLNKFDRASGEAKHLYFYPDTSQVRKKKERISAILETKNGQFWIGTDLDGLKLLNRDTEVFKHFKTDSENPRGKISHNNISVLFEDHVGNFWIGTLGGGLNKMDLATCEFTWYKAHPGDKTSISANDISVIYETRGGTLWVGTYGGSLNSFDYRTGKFRQYVDHPDFANHSTINGILEDKSGVLWLSTNQGIVRFNPVDNNLISYDFRDGLQGNEFNGNACYLDPADGRMYFGGGNGLTVFLPDDIIPNSSSPQIVLTDLKIFNKSVKIGEKKDGVVVLNESITVAKEITLSYQHTVFTLEYAGIHFVSPGRNKYKFKMVNVDKEWNDAGNRRTATYVHVPPGEYTFKVKAANSDGIWTEKEGQLKITIIPPFTATWWFRGIVLGVFALFLLGGHRYRTRRLRNKLAEQTRVQKILKQSRDEMQRSRDLAELRSAENELLLTAISSIIIAVDSNGEIFQWNEAAEDFFGITPEKAAKRTFIDMLNDCIPREYLEEIMIKGLEEGHRSKEIEFAVDLKCRGQGIKMLLSSINPIIDREGKKLGFLLLAEDISNRREEEMQENLSRKLESLGQLASGIAHEIKTPLQYIGHNATFVSDSFSEVNRFFNTVNDIIPEIDRAGAQPESERLRLAVVDFDMEYIMDEIPRASEQIINGVNRVSNIIRALNEFSYPGRGYKERCNLNALLKSTMVVVQNRIKKVAEMKLELYEDLPPVPCYPGELNQVFLNILVNAADAVAESGRWGLIKVATEIEGEEVVIEISDSGCGIPDENKESIFNPFFTTKEVGKGTGQGLALVHNVIIDKHNGKLDFTSEVGTGTTFFIRLPIGGGE